MIEFLSCGVFNYNTLKTDKLDKKQTESVPRVQVIMNLVLKNDELNNRILSFIPLNSLSELLINRHFCELVHKILLSRLDLEKNPKILSSRLTKLTLTLGNNFSKQYLPFKVAKLMATTIPYKFVNTISKKDLNKYEAETSCIHNLYALIAIFSGLKKAQTICDRLELLTTSNFLIDINKEKKWKWKVANLFSGDAVSEFNSKIDDNLYNATNRQKSYRDFLLPSFNQFMKYTQPIIEKCKMQIQHLEESDKEYEQTFTSNLEKAWKTIDYNFNSNTYDRLCIEFFENIELVNEDNSFIYYIVLTKPSNDTFSSHDIYHAFAIEQYYSNDKEKVYYRIYQSWAEKMTLKDYFEKKGYGDLDEGAMTYGELNTFLCDFDKILVGKGTEKIREECFGYGAVPSPQLVVFNSEERILSGLSLRFIASSINPGDCFDNFADALKSKAI